MYERSHAAAYLATAVGYTCKTFMKLTPDRFLAEK
jgi:hypothetical protein